MSHIVFTIKTNSYAGNFHREMASFITGQPWSYDFELEEQATAELELTPEAKEWFEDHTYFVLSENDSQYVEVSNESRGDDIELYFEELPPKEIMETIKERSHRWVSSQGRSDNIKVIGFGLKKVTQTEQELPL